MPLTLDESKTVVEEPSNRMRVLEFGVMGVLLLTGVILIRKQTEQAAKGPPWPRP